MTKNYYFTVIYLQKFDDDVAGNPAYKTTFDVAMFASGSWKKVYF